MTLPYVTRRGSSIPCSSKMGPSTNHKCTSIRTYMQRPNIFHRYGTRVLHTYGTPSLVQWRRDREWEWNPGVRVCMERRPRGAWNASSGGVWDSSSGWGLGHRFAVGEAFGPGRSGAAMDGADCNCSWAELNPSAGPPP
jgi:hypothetical protein